MKTRLLLIPVLLLFAGSAYSQSGCSSVPVQSPIVPKPTGGGIVSATCSAFVVTWKGSSSQTYTVGGTARDPVTNQTTPLPEATPTTSDNGENYTATIPVAAGSLVSWNVQAVQTIDGRTFTSYPFRGEYDYNIPRCEVLSMNGNLYPNPVESVLTVRYTSTVSEKEVSKTRSVIRNNNLLKIFDISGRSVLVQEAASTNMQVDVSRLRSGSYVLVVEDKSGKVVFNANFVKK